MINFTADLQKVIITEPIIIRADLFTNKTSMASLDLFIVNLNLAPGC